MQGNKFTSYYQCLSFFLSLFMFKSRKVHVVHFGVTDNKKAPNRVYACEESKSTSRLGSLKFMSNVKVFLNYIYFPNSLVCI